MRLSARSYLLALLLVAACVIGTAWAYTALLPMAFLESGYPIYVAKQAILRGCRFGDALVLGDSRPDAAFIPKLLPLPAANLSFAATTPLENRVFAEQAMRCPKPPKLVIYSHSMSSFLHPNQYLWKNAARYGYLTFDDLRQAAATAERLHDASLAEVDTHDGLTGLVRDVVYGIRFPSIFMASLIEARGFGRYGTNKVLLRRTAETNGQTSYGNANGGSAPGIDADVRSFVPSPLEATSFADTLALFAARGVKVLILAMPVSEAAFRAMDPAAMTAYEIFLADAARRHPGPFSTPPVIVAWPDEYFIDGSHLNERGATIFTHRIAACLDQWQQAPDRPVPCDLSWK